MSDPTWMCLIIANIWLASGDSFGMSGRFGLALMWIGLTGLSAVSS